MIRTREVVVEPFEHTRFTDRELIERDLGIVAASRAMDEVAPGTQIGVSVMHGTAVLERCGKLFVDNSLYIAAGRLLQQFAYTSGVGPGHAGVFTDPRGGQREVLASRRVVSELRKLDQTDTVGYFHMVDTQGLSESQAGFSESRATRQPLDVVNIYGVTLANVSALLCPDTLDTLTDPIDHDPVGRWFREAGLRQNKGPGLQ